MIKVLKPRLTPPGPRLKTARQVRDKAYSPDATVRGWYRSKRWQELRLDVFARDGLICQRTGVFCNGEHPAANSPVANHKVPHKGDPVLFWSIDNIETVTKEVHDSDIRREELAANRRL